MTKKLLLTRKVATKQCLLMWEELAQTGSRGKYSTKAAHLDGYPCPPLAGCWLCEYGHQLGSPCDHCPLVTSLGVPCIATPYIKWETAKTIEQRQQFAKEFLEILRKI